MKEDEAATPVKLQDVLADDVPVFSFLYISSAVPVILSCGHAGKLVTRPRRLGSPADLPAASGPAALAHPARKGADVGLCEEPLAHAAPRQELFV